MSNLCCLHYYLYHATRGDLLRRAERRGEAVASYRRALALCENATERRFFQRRIAELGATLHS